MSRRRAEHARPSRRVTSDPRWKVLRLKALERDGWACVRCGARRRLEVDHILPVRDRPDLGFVLDNLQVLCARHHAAKTRTEVGHPVLSPPRQAWRDLLRGMTPLPEQQGE